MAKSKALTEEKLEQYMTIALAQRKVRKLSNKPFKSKEKVNTVTQLVVHPLTKNLAYKFVEDDSIVECRTCTEQIMNTTEYKEIRNEN